MIENMVFIPSDIFNGLKFLDIEIDDIKNNGLNALKNLSEIDKGKITGIYSDFLEYIYSDNNSNTDICKNNDSIITIYYGGEHIVIVLNEEIDFDSLDTVKQMFQAVCNNIVKKYKGDDFASIPSEILKRVV